MKDVLKKISSGSIRTLRMTPTETPNPYAMLSPKRSVPTSPLKTSSKLNSYAHKVPQQGKKYAMNKTSYGTSYLKS